MGPWDVVEDVGDLMTDVGKDVGEAVVDVGDIFGDAPLVGLGNPALGILAQLNEVIELGGKLVGWAGDIGSDKLLFAASSPILAAGQAVIADMRATTGSGWPEAGDQLGDAELRFRQATDVLKSAHPNGDWTGSGSDAYFAAAGRQEGRSAELGGLDRQLQDVIAREAAQITRTRAKLDDESSGLAEFGLTSIGYGLIPGVGPAIKQAAELQAVLKALSVCSAELQKLADEVDANAAAGQQLAGQYPSAAEGAGNPGCIPGQDGPYGRATPSGSGAGAARGGTSAGAGGGSASLVAEVIKAAAPGDVQGGRAPAHVEPDVDPARLDQPMTVILDRDHPIVLPSATTTSQDK